MNAKANVWAVVPAAGSGSRMQQRKPKQYVSIANKTVLEHSIEILLGNLELSALIVCVPEQDDTALGLIKRNAVLAECFARQQLRVVDGGESRAQSVLNGLKALDEQASDDDWVLVHDAARPCVDSNDLRTLYESLKDDAVGGILAVPAKDTLKVASNGRVVSTLNRDEVWHALTPQMFRLGLLKGALAKALSEGVAVTDESSALEYAGFEPKLVKGSHSNIKITTQDDLLLAEQFLL